MSNDTKTPTNTSTDSQNVLNEILIDYLKERRQRRFWAWIKRFFYLIILIGVVLLFFLSAGEENGSKDHVGLIDLNGEISDTKSANADDFAKGIDQAYKNKGLKAVILRINSPGGSPVQAEYMYNALKYYRKKYPQIKVYAVCSDLCASAAYYVAVAADAIYASPASMVGSIGVVFNGFGFVDVMQKVGISRRLQVAGTNKGFMDAFSPESAAQKQKLQVMLDLIHKQFIARVKAGRGDKLLIDEDTFSGLIWTGEQALAIGLIDGYGSSGQVAREVIKINRVIDYTRKQNLMDRVSKNLGTAMADSLANSLGMKSGLRQ